MSRFPVLDPIIFTGVSTASDLSLNLEVRLLFLAAVPEATTTSLSTIPRPGFSLPVPLEVMYVPSCLTASLNQLIRL